MDIHIKTITVAVPYLVDQFFEALGLDKNEEYHSYILEQFRKYEEQKITDIFVNGFNTGAQQQRYYSEPQFLSKIEYKKFLTFNVGKEII